MLKKHISNILAHHDKIVLCFSGGIDSLVLLSFIESFGTIDKTLLVNYENYFVDNHPDLLRNNQYKSDTLKRISLSFPNNFIKCNITDYDWLRCANYGNFTELKLYATSTIMHKFPHHAVITGHQGDKTLLHDVIWIDQLLLHNENNKDKFIDLLQNKKLYMNNFLNYDTNKKFSKLKNYTLHLKHWNELNGVFFNPLGIDTRLCRRIDISTLTLEDILDARVAREIIYRNVGKKYDDFITHQGNLDGDNYSKKFFNKKDFNADIFVIPANINHNENGLNWLKELLKNNSIETNTLTSLKMIQYISKIYNRF